MSEHQMGLLSASSFVVGNVIGAGIFLTPSSVLRSVGSVGLSLSVWAVCALISVLGALCYIELGTGVSEAGCDFAYVVHVGWHALAFAFMWVSVLLTYPASGAVQALTFGQYAMQGLAPVFTLNPPYHAIAERGLGLLLLVLLTWINFYSLGKVAARFQVVFTIAKLLAMAIIIIAGLYLLVFKGWNANFAHPMKDSNWRPGDLVLGLYGGLWSYTGWDILNYGTPEIRKPRRTLPLALISGIFVVAVVYMTINVSYFVVLDLDAIRDTDAIAALFSQKVLGNFSYVVPFLICVLLCGTLNSNIFVGSRYTHAAARESHLPPFLSCIHAKSASPRAALVAQGILTAAISFIDIDSLINYVIFVIWAQKSVTMAALLYIRLAGIPVSRDVIRMPLIFSAAFLLISTALVIIPIWQDWEVTLVGVGIVANGFIFYFVFVRVSTLPAPLARLNDALTRCSEKLFNSVVDVKSMQKEKRTSLIKEDCCESEEMTPI